MMLHDASLDLGDTAQFKISCILASLYEVKICLHRPSCLLVPLYVRDLLYAKKGFAEFSSEILFHRSLQEFVEQT
jgi:hypothetical protein